MTTKSAIEKLLSINIYENLNKLNKKEIDEIFKLVQTILNDKNDFESTSKLLKKKAELTLLAEELRKENKYDDYANVIANLNKFAIEKYITWFQNLSFFGDNSFVPDNIESLYGLLNTAGSILSKLENYNFPKIIFSSSNNQETINLTQTFFYAHNINIDVSELLNKNVINFKNDKYLKKGNFYNINVSGKIYEDKDGNKKIDVCTQNNVFDGVLLVHEIMHYLNGPAGERNIVSHMLTESISYAIELIYSFEMLSFKRNKDSDLVLILIEKTLYALCYNTYHIYKIILLYKKTGNISENDYISIFNDKKYYETLNEFERYISNSKSIFKDTYYIFGLVIAIYLFEEYKLNPVFFDKIIEFSENINTKSFNDCLNIIGLSNMNLFKTKIKSALNLFVKDLESSFIKDKTFEVSKSNVN